MPDMPTSITICIRTYNEVAFIGKCLESVLSQKSTMTLDVLVIDSGSTDGTVQAARRFPVRIHEIPSSAFHYATTLNLGVHLSQSELFVPLSAHAIPSNASWLQPLVDAVRQVPTVAAAYSRQKTHANADPYEIELAHRYYPPNAPTGKKGREPGNSFGVVFSNTSSCIRTRLLREIPFRKIPRCEDRLWATEIQRRGYSIVYVPESCVFHSHNYLPCDYYRMGKLDGAAKELADGPVRNLFASLGMVLPCSLLSRSMDFFVRTVATRMTTRPLQRLAVRYCNAAALRLGQVDGILEGKKIAGAATGSGRT